VSLLALPTSDDRSLQHHSQLLPPNEVLRKVLPIASQLHGASNPVPASLICSNPHRRRRSRQRAFFFPACISCGSDRKPSRRQVDDEMAGFNAMPALSSSATPGADAMGLNAGASLHVDFGDQDLTFDDALL
jgi:hypothetical protein